MNASTGCLRKYYKDICIAPLLTPDEERVLARKAKAGDAHAKQRLIQSNLRFVIKMATAYRNQGMSLDDLVQEGNLGLIEAVEKFDPERGNRLTTYASWWIRLALQRAVEQKTRPVKIPINKFEAIKRIRAFRNAFNLRHGREPLLEEIAEHLSVSMKVLDKIQSLDNSYVSMDSPPDEEHTAPSQQMPDTNIQDPGQTIQLEQMREKLGKAMDVLTSKERMVMSRRFGLNGDYKGLSLRQIGRCLGLSAEGVRRIEEQALRKLRRPVVRRQIEGLLQ